MNNEKKDYSTQCNLNDEDMNNPCHLSYIEVVCLLNLVALNNQTQINNYLGLIE